MKKTIFNCEVNIATMFDIHDNENVNIFINDQDYEDDQEEREGDDHQDQGND